MSMAVTVLLPKNVQPWSASDLNQVIQELGFELTLDEFDPKDFSGYLPCRHRHVGAGFEYYSESASEYLEEAETEEFVEQELERFRAHDRVVEFVTHSGFRDRGAAVIAAACLTKLANGYLLDNATGQWKAPSETAEWARREEAQLRSDYET